MWSVRWIEAVWRSGTAPQGTWVLLQGSSMEPTYAGGDWLLVRPLAGAPPVRPGDVVVARRGDCLVTHRVVELRDGMATTKGDACQKVDSPVPFDALLGRVESVRRNPIRFWRHRLVRRLVLGLKSLRWRGR